MGSMLPDLDDNDAATPNIGRARAPLGYRDGDNVAQDPKPAVIGAVSTDAQRRGRSASAERFRTFADLDETDAATPNIGRGRSALAERFWTKTAKRCDRYLAKNPDAGRDEAMSYAMASKQAWKAFKAWRTAS
jgi:hypothetical protein